MVGDKHLPEHEHECHRPDHRPEPQGQLVEEQLPLTRAVGIQVALVQSEEAVNTAREQQEGERTRNPPGAEGGGAGHQRKDQEGNKVRESIGDRGLDGPGADDLRGARAARLHTIARHGNPLSYGIRVPVAELIAFSAPRPQQRAITARIASDAGLLFQYVGDGPVLSRTTVPSGTRRSCSVYPI